MDNAVEILHTLDMPIFRISPTGLTQFLNINCSDVYHVDPIRIENKHYSAWLDRETCRALDTFLKQVSPHNTQSSCTAEIRESSPNSKAVLIQWRISAFFDLGETLLFFQVHGNDVSEIVERERLVKQHAEQFKWTFENSPVPLWREDFSRVIDFIDDLKQEGVEDIGQYLIDHPRVLENAISLVKILDVNHATVTSFGYERKEELIGNLSDHFHESIYETFRLELIAIANGEDSFKMESPAIHRSGKLMSTLIFMSIPKKRELFKEIIIAHIDISELKDTEKALELAKREAEQANKAKSTFVSNISHELRTPLNGIIGFSKLLSQEPLDDKQRDFVETIRGCSDTLLSLINQVLDLSKIESVKMGVNKAPFNPAGLLEEIAKVQSLDAGKKGVSLDLDIASSLPKTIQGDRLKINQIISNITRNAVKFCNQGRIQISGKLENDLLIFQVRDEGIGISEGALRTIFEPFTQEDNSNSRKHTGTGLGLTIARELARIMGGELEIQSKKEVGTLCVFTLPYEPGSIPEIDIDMVSAEKIEAHDPRGMKVLIVDDNKLNIRLLEQFLKPYGLDISSCFNGQEALTALETNKTTPFDAVFMDLQMPIMNGYEAITKIRAGDVAGTMANIPIAVVSANVLQNEIQKVAALGVEHFIPKPVDPDILKKFLEAAAKARRDPNETAAPAT